MTTADPVHGKSVLITGGTTGIGRAIAIDLAARGARILTFGRHQRELDDALKDIRKANAEAQGMIADAAKPDDIKAVFKRVDELFGGLDILIANAAIGGEAFMEASDKDWRYLIETNVSGYLACAKEAAVRMQKQGGGQIILIGSISADNRGAHGATYAASKAAVQAFAESFAKEVAKDKIRVSLIEPGAVKSDMQDGTAEDHEEKVRKHEMLAAEDIAACTFYILSQPERCTVQTVRIVPRLEDEF